MGQINNTYANKKYCLKKDTFCCSVPNGIPFGTISIEKIVIIIQIWFDLTKYFFVGTRKSDLYSLHKNSENELGNLKKDVDDFRHAISERCI